MTIFPFVALFKVVMLSEAKHFDLGNAPSTFVTPG